MNNSIKRAAVGVAGVVTYLVISASNAWAQAVDPTAGAFGDAVTDAQGGVTGFYAPALFALGAVILGIVLGFKWFKKGRSVGS